MENKIMYGYELGERYVIRRALGKGAEGSVFLAYDNKLGKCWAVKVCRGRSKREIEALKTIDHFAFPRIVDVIETDETTFLIMDYIEGETLERYSEKHALSQKQILLWGRKTAEALNYLHSCSPAMIYMDCKPENIMITPSGDIRLIDLGSIYVCDNEKDKTISGTRFYAPEEVKHFGLHNDAMRLDIPDERSDIYSLGMTMYYLLMGRKVEYRDSHGKLILRRQNRNISRMTEYIIQKCTCPKKNDRYQSMMDLKEDIKLSLSKSPGKFLLWRKSVAGPFVIKMTDVIIKSLLAFLILFFAQRYSKDQSNPAMLLIPASAFILACRSRTVYCWENRKSVYRGMGAKMLLTILIAIKAVSPQSLEAAQQSETKVSNDDVLDVTLYDCEGRCLLVKPGCVWHTQGDIHMSIDADELTDGASKITVISEKNGEKHSYSFMCESK